MWAYIVLALCAFAEDREAGTAMLNFLRGPQGDMKPSELSFIKDRFMDGKKYMRGLEKIYREIYRLKNLARLRERNLISAEPKKER